MKKELVLKPISKLRYYASLLEALLFFALGAYVTHIASKYAYIKASKILF